MSVHPSNMARKKSRENGFNLISGAIILKEYGVNRQQLYNSKTNSIHSLNININAELRNR